MSYGRHKTSPLLTGGVKIAAWVACAIAVAGFVYSELPVLGFGWYGVLWLSILPLTVFAYSIWSEDDRRAWMLALSPVFLAMILGVATSPVFFADTYRNLLSSPTEKGVGLPSLQFEKSGLVSEEMAQQTAVKLLSTEASLGSKVHVGRLQKQIVKGHLVWVGFLEHNSLSQWYVNNVTPGYVMVSAHDVEDAKLVTGLKMRYLDSGRFGDSIERRAWQAAPTVGLTDFSPEIDDSGRPFWVATILKPAVAFGGTKVDGVLVIDPQTGDTTRYGLNDVPAWIDRVYPQSVAESLVHMWGQYIHGFMNAMFSGEDVLRVSANADLVYGEDGRAYWYLGLASNGRDNGINGYMLIDSRTGASSHYVMAGAKESVAIDAVLGLMREKQYHVGNALPYVVNGEPTYVVVATDNTGIARAFGLMSIRNYQVVAASNTLVNAARLYQSKLANQGGGNLQQVIETKTLAGMVARVAQDTRGGNTSYYMKLVGTNLIFIASSELSDKLPLTAAGDKVTLQYQEGAGQTTVPLSAFSNDSL